MNLPVVFRPEAEEDAAAARGWYERQQPGLGDEFTDALARQIIIIGRSPKLFAVSFKGVRRP